MSTAAGRRSPPSDLRLRRVPPTPRRPYWNMRYATASASSASSPARSRPELIDGVARSRAEGAATGVRPSSLHQLGGRSLPAPSRCSPTAPTTRISAPRWWPACSIRRAAVGRILDQAHVRRPPGRHRLRADARPARLTRARPRPPRPRADQRDRRRARRRNRAPGITIDHPGVPRTHRQPASDTQIHHLHACHGPATESSTGLPLLVPERVPAEVRPSHPLLARGSARLSESRGRTEQEPCRVGWQPLPAEHALRAQAPDAAVGVGRRVGAVPVL